MEPPPPTLIRSAASSFEALLAEARACTICAGDLPCGPRPVLQGSSSARILIAAQAPGRKVHASGLPFDDASGDRLRAWMGVSREVFYDPRRVAILPMGFCYPGTGRAGDLPPRPECAPAWRGPLLAGLGQVELTLVIGAYAQAYHLGSGHGSVTEAVAAWRGYWPRLVPLPRPSPRNNPWFKRHPWFELEVLPVLQERIAGILA